MMTRREFLDGAVASAAGLAISSTAKSYAQIIGANNRLNFAVIGLNGPARPRPGSGSGRTPEPCPLVACSRRPAHARRDVGRA